MTHRHANSAPPPQSTALLARLKALPPLAELSPQALSALVEVGSPRSFRAGEEVLSQGEVAERFFIVLHGRLKLCRPVAGGRNAFLSLFGPGDLFGTVAALGGHPCSAAVVAMESCSCLEVRRDPLFDLFARHGELVAELLPLLTRHLAECGNCLVEVTCLKVEARFAQLLARLADNVGVERADGTLVPVHLSRQELADMTGTTIETAIRVMSRWGKEGLVETRDDGFLVHDTAALEQLVER